MTATKRKIDNVLTTADKIIQAKIWLTNKNPFFSYILMNFRIERKDEIQTMGVDRYGYLLWNEEFVKSLPFNELCGVLCHEVGHIVYQTFDRLGSRNLMLWNIATDLTINWTIAQYDYLKLPKMVLMPDKDGVFKLKIGMGGVSKPFSITIKEKTAEDVYDQLAAAIDDVEKFYNESGGFDKHLYNNDAPGSQGKNVPGGDTCTNDEHDGTDGDLNRNAKEWEKITTEAAVAAKQRQPGCVPGEMGRFLDAMLNPQINWKKKLMSFITKEFPSNYTMSRPGRRYYSTGTYFPTLLRESLSVNVGVDCSGSIGQNDYNTFIAEIIGIARGFDNVKMYIQYWDTEVRNELEIFNGNIETIKSFKVTAGGGTCLSSWGRYLKEKKRISNVHVCLTDGCVEGGKNHDLPNGHIIFVLSDGGSPDIVKQYGEVTSLKHDGRR